MIGLMFFCLLFLIGLFWIGLKVTGALFTAVFWLAFRLPLAIILGTLGFAVCCTIILIPLGIWLLKTGFQLLVPGHLVS